MQTTTVKLAIVGGTDKKRNSRENPGRVTFRQIIKKSISTSRIQGNILKRFHPLPLTNAPRPIPKNELMSIRLA
jgi:hypothetical protein